MRNILLAKNIIQYRLITYQILYISVIRQIVSMGNMLMRLLVVSVGMMMAFGMTMVMFKALCPIDEFLT